MFKKLKKAVEAGTLENAKTILVRASDAEFGEFIEAVIAYRRINTSPLSTPATQAELDWAKWSPAFLATLERQTVMTPRPVSK